METIVDFEIGNGCVIMDRHTIKSIYLGENQYGYKEFDNEYTQLGELVNALKYKNRKSAASEIVNLIKEQLDDYIDKVDLIIPVPPSNKIRLFQPVNEIVKAFAEYLEKDYKLDLLYKINNEQAKDGKNIANTIKKNYNLDRKVNILLVDDLYRTGNTLRECCKVLKQDENVNNIYCLVMTRTKNK